MADGDLQDTIMIGHFGPSVQRNPPPHSSGDQLPPIRLCRAECLLARLRKDGPTRLGASQTGLLPRCLGLTRQQFDLALADLLDAEDIEVSPSACGVVVRVVPPDPTTAKGDC